MENLPKTEQKFGDKVMMGFFCDPILLHYERTNAANINVFWLFLCMSLYMYYLTADS